MRGQILYRIKLNTSFKNIICSVTLPYHPKDNGQVESTHKVIQGILTKNLKSHHRDWAEIIPKDLWAYWTTWVRTRVSSPYEFVYGKNVVFPVEFKIKTLSTFIEEKLDLT